MVARLSRHCLPNELIRRSQSHSLRRPRTREGTRERAERGFEGKYERAVERLLTGTHEGCRRVRYYALRDLRCLGELTPLALDERVEVGDTTGEELLVHTG